MNRKEEEDITTILELMEQSKGGKEKKLIEISVADGLIKVETDLGRSLTIHMLEFATFLVVTKTAEGE